MIEKNRYFLCTINSGDKTIHTEIVKVISRHEDPKDNQIRGLTMAMLETLYARDALASWSRVRLIREQIDSEMNELHRKAEEIEDEAEGARRYEEQMAARDHSNDPRLFDDALRAISNQLL